MALVDFFKTLHFRLSAAFVFLLILGAVIFVIWADRTVYTPDIPDGSDEWYENRSDSELDSLAVLVTGILSDMALTDSLIVDYYERVKDFDVEISLIDSLGRTRVTTRPQPMAVLACRVNTTLLDSMSLDEWDFSRYPDPYEMESFVNRITHVRRLYVGPDSTVEPSGYLIATFPPSDFSEEEFRADNRSLMLQGSVLILLTSALSGLLVMGWISRRINNLAGGVNASRKGQLDQRVPAHNGDELGRLGHDFNMMALSLSDLIDRLKRSEQFHRRLVANMSHDLRTPLAALRGYVETLTVNENIGTAEQRDHFHKRITANVDHIERLIHHIFQLSKLDAGDVRFEMENFSIEELTRDLIRVFEGLAKDKRVDLLFEAEDGLPQVHADPAQIGQVLQNLVDNALKFSGRGDKVGVLLRAVDRGVDVEITDNGPGIDPEDLAHVTERFYTGDKSRTRKGDSAGLGLAITEKILLRHGSRLRITSDPDRETKFTFFLPTAPQDEVESP